ncbi:MAG: hypothetical protein ACRDD2_11160 [Sarcina sp.]
MDNNTKDKSELERIIEETNRKNINIFSQKQLNNEKERILDEELKIIKEKIKKSNPKWHFKNFDEFFYTGYSKVNKKNEIKVKVYGKEEFKTLIKISKKLQSEDNNFAYELLSKNFYRFIFFSRNLNKAKVEELIKSYIFYSNTKYENKKLKFTNEKFPIWVYALILIGSLIIILIAIIAIGLIAEGAIDLLYMLAT